MYQIFVLSVLVNIGVGFVLAYDFFDHRFEVSRFLSRTALDAPRFRIGTGSVAFGIGFLKFIFVFPGQLAVIGDVLPALAGLVTGLTLISEQLGKRENVSSSISTLSGILVPNAQWIGLASVLIGILHLVFPGVAFL
jgi:hypothetical protein